jgi:hypothetical protein
MIESKGRARGAREAVGIQEQREKAMDALKIQIQDLEKENKETRSMMLGI